MKVLSTNNRHSPTAVDSFSTEIYFSRCVSWFYFVLGFLGVWVWFCFSKWPSGNFLIEWWARLWLLHENIMWNGVKWLTVVKTQNIYCFCHMYKAFSLSHKGNSQFFQCLFFTNPYWLFFFSSFLFAVSMFPCFIFLFHTPPAPFFHVSVIFWNQHLSSCELPVWAWFLLVEVNRTKTGI